METTEPRRRAGSSSQPNSPRPKGKTSSPRRAAKSVADRMSELEVAQRSSEQRLTLSSNEAPGRLALWPQRGRQVAQLRQENEECRDEVRRLQVELDATRTLRRQEMGRLTRELDLAREHVAALTAQIEAGPGQESSQEPRWAEGDGRKLLNRVKSIANSITIKGAE